MRAKFVNEGLSFERGRDPLDSLDIGIKSIGDLGSLRKRPVHVFKKGNNPIMISRGYLLWKLLKFIDDRDLSGDPAGYTDCVRYYYQEFGGQSYGRRTLGIGVWNSLQKYIKKYQNKKYSLNGWGKEYLQKYSFFDDGRTSLKEGLEFTRGIDPKEAMGIGAWRNGYLIEKEPAFDIKVLDGRNYYRINFDPKKWHFTKKASSPDEVDPSKVNNEMSKLIEPLPVISFKYYYSDKNFLGLFGDWPEDFPFIMTPFIATCLEEEDRTFLIEPEGFTYARYITELI
jgi:hypothetical protein